MSSIYVHVRLSGYEQILANFTGKDTPTELVLDARPKGR